MGCLRVNIQKILSDLKVKTASLNDIFVSAVSCSSDLLVRTFCNRESLAVSVSDANSNLSVSAHGIGGDIKVKAFLVCGSGLSDEYYLIVEDGYVLTIDDKYVTVQRNA